MEMLARPTAPSIVPASANRPFLLVLESCDVADSRVCDVVRDLSRGCITSFDGSSGEGGEDGKGEALELLASLLLLSFRDSADSFSLSIFEVLEVLEVPRLAS